VSALDAILTRLAMSMGGVELNPIMNLLMRALNPNLAIVVNSIISLGILALLAYFSVKLLSRWAWVPMTVYILVRSVPVILSLRALLLP